MELWKLNTGFKLFLLAIAASFLVSALFHYTPVLHYLPILLAIGVAVYASLIINPTLRRRSFRVYVLSTVLVVVAMAASVTVVGYYSLTFNSCASAGTTPLDWSGSVLLDAERHPYLDSGVPYQFNFSLVSGPGFRVRVSQDPSPTPVLYSTSVYPSTSSKVWNYTPSSCGKYWIELLNIGFPTQSSSYHVVVVTTS